MAAVSVQYMRPPNYQDSFPPPDPSIDEELNARNTPDSEPQTNILQPINAKDKWVKILDQLIMNLSDQQLATSIAILVTAFIRQCQLSNFHLKVVSDLAWFSTITHLLSMVVLRVHWMKATRQRVLWIRVIIMVCVVIMLAFTLIWAPQYEPKAGMGACPAHCAFTHKDADALLSEFELPVQHTALNFASAVQTVLLVWGYFTTGLFISHKWYWLYRYCLWKFPRCVFRYSRSFCLWTVGRIWKHGRVHGRVEKAFGWLKSLWKMVLFPLPKTVIGVQVASWIFGLAFLVADRWGSHESVAMPEVENQWGFGQLLAMIIVALPVLPLMEIWAGEHIFKVDYICIFANDEVIRRISQGRSAAEHGAAANWNTTYLSGSITAFCITSL